MGYSEAKAKKMYELFLKGLPCKKVYAVVKKDDKFVVLKEAEGRKWKYQLAGGGVEEGENNEIAIKREIAEELNMLVNVVKSLGMICYSTNWIYDGKEFSVNYESEIMLTEFVGYSDNDKFGLEGEFSSSSVVGKCEISEEEMLKNVYEFVSAGIKLR